MCGMLIMTTLEEEPQGRKIVITPLIEAIRARHTAQEQNHDRLHGKKVSCSVSQVAEKGSPSF